MEIIGNIFDLVSSSFVGAKIVISKGVVVEVVFLDKLSSVFVLPGLIDSHVHIESSMLVPSVFSELAVRRGVVSVVTDPHEIANVLGVDGVDFMMRNALLSPLKIFFGVPSCVPATSFETSGAVISSSDIAVMMKNQKVVALSEMMNFPGVLNSDKEVLSKLSVAKSLSLPIDGHAPGLTGDDLFRYINAGVSTDHEAVDLKEAIEKIEKGMMIQIREGSAAKNFESLWPLLDLYSDKVMLCSDDCHPDDLQKKYIDDIFRRALSNGVKFENLYKAAFLNPKKHYDLKNVGTLNVGDSADFIVLDDINDFVVKKTFIDGNCVFDGTKTYGFSKNTEVVNKFRKNKITVDDLSVKSLGGILNVIKIFDGELLTDYLRFPIEKGEILSDVANDILKIVVLNRYDEFAKPTVGFINGFKLKKGAISSSIGHDSHNIIAIGVDDDSLLQVINKVIDLQGGVVVASDKNIDFLRLEVAGLMTNSDSSYVVEKYAHLNKLVKNMGCELKSPFMTLSFMPLLVIPSLKIGDKGLFDITKYSFVDLVE